MNLRSSISSFNKRPLAKLALGAFVALAVLFAGDRLLFRAFYPLYNQWYKFASTAGSEILAVGSSHIAFAIDDRELARLTRRKVGLISVPGTSLELRYYLIKDRIEQAGPPPDVILLETSRHVFDRKRYPSENSLALFMPYYHRGYFRGMVTELKPKLKDRWWREGSQLYSINHAFAAITDPRNVGRYVIGLFGDKIYDLIKVGMRTTFDAPPVCRASDDSMKAATAEWKRARGDAGIVAAADPELENWLKKIVELTAAHGVRLVLLDVPYYEYSDDIASRDEHKARNTLRAVAASKPRISYVQLEMPNDPCFFQDTSHLGIVGQAHFTKQMADWLLSVRYSNYAPGTPLDQI